MQQLRARVAQMDRQMSLVRAMEHLRGRNRAQGAGQHPTANPPLPGQGQPQAPPPLRHQRRRRAAHRHARRGTEPRAGRRTGAGFTGIDRRRAGHRQVHPHPPDRATHARKAHPLRIGRRERPPAEAARRPPGPHVERLPHRLRDVAGADLRTHQEHTSGPGGDRLHTDHLHRSTGVLPRQHHAGKGMRRRHPALRQGEPHARHPHRTYQQGRKPGRTEGAGAHRGHGAAIRGRPALHVPHPAQHQEPLRRGRSATLRSCCSARTTRA